MKHARARKPCGKPRRVSAPGYFLSSLPDFSNGFYNLVTRPKARDKIVAAASGMN